METNVEQIKNSILSQLHTDTASIAEIQDAAEAIAELWEMCPRLARTIEKAFIILGEG